MSKYILWAGGGNKNKKKYAENLTEMCKITRGIINHREYSLSPPGNPVSIWNHSTEIFRVAFNKRKHTVYTNKKKKNNKKKRSIEREYIPRPWLFAHIANARNPNRFFFHSIGAVSWTPESFVPEHEHDLWWLGIGYWVWNRFSLILG